ncbi:endonuclease/exonuclease/phosphatase family protein [Mycobacterium intermedium]|uniref:endonuclease/exonuclease/phosphatase family protein n=1 Tax=Mycobacterium intermedium TaxID=28445 RepID=UPI001E3753B0|nr:endonuclease/exonuclease/phosphatase family protein [Mycobacterium intermedium]
MTINIRHGGGTTDRVDALVTRMLGYDADMLVVSEFRANANGARLQAALERSGYATSHPVAAPRQNSVLIASRWPIERSWAFSQTLESHHLWCAATTEMAICGVYMPQGAAKVSYWESLIQHGVGSGIDLFIGDFNTGNNDLDKDPGGTKFYGPELPGRFIGTGYIDIWRARHPRTREYSWFSPTKANNGFRLDHAYARPGLNERVVSCEFDHTPRLLNETDHSALIVSIASD